MDCYFLKVLFESFGYKRLFSWGRTYFFISVMSRGCVIEEDNINVKVGV